jgi:Ca2+-binding EF-hand superfamily protein
MSSRPALKRTASVVEFAKEFEQDHVKVMKELFVLCDRDGDGLLTRRELVNVMKELNVQASERDVARLYSELAADSNGITFENFLLGIQFIQKVRTLFTVPLSALICVLPYVSMCV